MDNDREIERKLLAKWVSQRDKLNRLIEGLQEELGEEMVSASHAMHYESVSSTKETPKTGKLSIVPGEFFGLSQTDAAAKYLKKVGHAVHLNQILEVLTTGGVKFSGKDPKTNLYTVLVRGTRRFVLVSPSTFGLGEFYPTRSKLEKEIKPKKRRKRKKGKKKKEKPADTGNNEE